MGYLDKTTITVDAILTKKGRELLAKGSEHFSITQFALADDEVDYTIIEKFGRAVGKEKISKNTPIFEAQTKGSLALKNRLLTLPDPTIIRLPSLTITATNLVGNLLSFNTTTKTENKV